MAAAGIIEQILQSSGAVGIENRMDVQQLAALAGCGSGRRAQRMIEAERKAGALICSSPHARGYWLPKNRQEIEAFYKQMMARVRNILQAAEGARAVLEVVPGQITIDMIEQQAAADPEQLQPETETGTDEQTRK